MRVLHVCAGNLYGGIETLLLTLAHERALGPALEPEVALCYDGRLRTELEATGVTVHRLPTSRASRPYSVLRARRALAGLLDSGAFDRVICHAAWPMAMFGSVVRRARIPLVFWAHDVMTGRPWTERWARRTCPDLVIFNSRYTAGSLNRMWPGVPAVVLTYPVDVSSAVLSQAERAAVHRELDTPVDATVLIQVSRMEAWKGHAMVVAALGRLPPQTNWVWWIVGGAQRSDEAAYVDLLVSSARRLGIADRVRFLGERQDVRRLLGAADVHCQANISPEPFGIAYVEALAAGLPVIASRAGGAVEIVDDSCGLLVPPGDVAALAAAIEQLIVDRVLRAKLASCAPARARQLSDPATQIGRLAAALAEMSLGGSGG